MTDDAINNAISALLSELHKMNHNSERVASPLLERLAEISANTERIADALEEINETLDEVIGGGPDEAKFVRTIDIGD